MPKRKIDQLPAAKRKKVVEAIVEGRSLRHIFERQYAELAKQIRVKPTPTSNVAILANMLARHEAERKAL